MHAPKKKEEKEKIDGRLMKIAGWYHSFTATGRMIDSSREGVSCMVRGYSHRASGTDDAAVMKHVCSRFPPVALIGGHEISVMLEGSALPSGGKHVGLKSDAVVDCGKQICASPHPTSFTAVPVA